MKIYFSPQRSDATLALAISNGLLVVNGQPYDFSAIPAGGSVSNLGSIVSCENTGDDFEVTVSLPHGKDADESVLFPEQVTVSEDGPIPVPGQSVTMPELLPVIVAVYVTPFVPTQNELDVARYTKRAAAKDGLIAYMAADNMIRVRSGEWTVQNLVDLLEDADVKALLNSINTLSFELAIARLNSATNPLLTAAIKQSWIAKLTAHLYLVP